MKILFCILGSITLVCTSCGYHYTAKNVRFADPITVTVPYIEGDANAILNNEVVYQLSTSGHFICSQSSGKAILQIKLLSDEKKRIGYRYDRDNVEGRREKNLLGIEDRRTVFLEAALLDADSQKELVAPFEVFASADYDYIDPGSPRDLLTSSSQSIIQFSLGQLDSYEGANDDTEYLISRRLAEKITRELVNRLIEQK